MTGRGELIVNATVLGRTECKAVIIREDDDQGGGVSEHHSEVRKAKKSLLSAPGRVQHSASRCPDMIGVEW